MADTLSVLQDIQDYGSAVTLPATFATRASIAGSNFVDGHRYFLFASAILEGSSARTDFRLLIGGVTTAQTHTTHQATGSSDVMLTTGTVRPMVNGQDVELQLDNDNGSGVSSNHTILAIDLDTDPTRFAENTDWFHVNEPTDEAVATAFGSETDPAQLTFTPDGTSDYLVIGIVRCANSTGSSYLVERIRDTTNGVTIVQDGLGSGNVGLETHNTVMFGIMQAPTAIPTTLKTEYRGASGIWTKDRAEILVIRLNAFVQPSTARQDINLAPGGAGSDISWTSIAAEPGDITSDFLFFADLKAETDGAFPSTTGLNGKFTAQPGSLWDTDHIGTQYLGSNTNLTGTDGGRSGPTVAIQLTGLPPGDTILAEYKAKTTSANNRLRLFQMAYFSLEFTPVNPPPIGPSPKIQQVKEFEFTNDQTAFITLDSPIKDGNTVVVAAAISGNNPIADISAGSAVFQGIETLTDASNVQTVEIWAAFGSSSGGSLVVVNLSAGNSPYARFCVIELEGVAVLGPTDQSNSLNTPLATAFGTGNITPSEINAVLVSAFSAGSAGQIISAAPSGAPAWSYVCDPKFTSSRATAMAIDQTEKVVASYSGNVALDAQSGQCVGVIASFDAADASLPANESEASISGSDILAVEEEV